MIKNKAEIERIGQEIGVILSRASIKGLYERDASLPLDLHCQKPNPFHLFNERIV